MKRSIILSQVARVNYIKSIVEGFKKVLFYGKLTTHTTPTAFGPIIDRSKSLYLLEDLSFFLYKQDSQALRVSVYTISDRALEVLWGIILQYINCKKFWKSL